MPAYHLTTHELRSPKMSTRSFSLPTSKRSGHPIFPTTGSVPPNYNHPTNETASDSPPGINISPQGTWKPVANGHPSANIEVLDLTDRFSYKPPMKAKTRPKNALKKGLKPTKTSDLPLKHPIYAISSGEEDDDGDDDDEAFSEPSPLQKKRPRMKTLNTYTNHHGSALEEMQAAAGENGPLTFNQVHIQLMSDETTLPSSPILPHSTNTNVQFSPNPSISSRTVQATNDNYHGEDMNKEPFATENAAFTTAQRNTTNFANVTGTEPLKPEHATTTNNNFATTAPTSLHIPHGIQNTAQPSLPILTPYILNHTTLRIYLPATRIYIPLKLRSCPTIHALFSAVTKILNYTDRRIPLLIMRLDGAEVRGKDLIGAGMGGKGVIAVHADLEDSWECFLEEVQRWEGWHEDQIFDLGVEVCEYMTPEGQGV
ncbi:MAG: hypothetical protein LQ343_005853 [Gyalolechia ehrenbergii]|nr:MAG: hypothetical protein LQ343_005853 [Gyalolechia ehrenbergii]